MMKKYENATPNALLLPHIAGACVRSIINMSTHRKFKDKFRPRSNN